MKSRTPNFQLFTSAALPGSRLDVGSGRSMLGSFLYALRSAGAMLNMGSGLWRKTSLAK